MPCCRYATGRVRSHNWFDINGYGFMLLSHLLAEHPHMLMLSTVNVLSIVDMECSGNSFLSCSWTACMSFDHDGCTCITTFEQSNFVSQTTTILIM